MGVFSLRFSQSPSSSIVSQQPPPWEEIIRLFAAYAPLGAWNYRPHSLIAPLADCCVSRDQDRNVSSRLLENIHRFFPPQSGSGSPLHTGFSRPRNLNRQPHQKKAASRSRWADLLASCALPETEQSAFSAAILRTTLNIGVVSSLLCAFWGSLPLTLLVFFPRSCPSIRPSSTSQK